MRVYEIRTFNGISIFCDNLVELNYQKSVLAMSGISYSIYGRCA